MAISLKKGQGISLKKQEHDLSKITIGLGWDIPKPPKTLKTLFKKEPIFDLDVFAILLHADGKVHNVGAKLETGEPSLVGGDVIFYSNMHHTSGQVWLTGDNRTGVGDGDDEQIILNLTYLPPEYQSIVFVVMIYQGASLGQSFDKVDNAFIRAIDRQGKEMVRFDLSGNSTFADCQAMTFATLKRDGLHDWHFEAIGRNHKTDNFRVVLSEYM